MSQSWVDSWVEHHGNNYIIRNNHGKYSLRDGFQVEWTKDGWSNNNVFSGNTADVQGPGYGYKIWSGTTGNVVKCDNVATNAGAGFANVTCKP